MGWHGPALMYYVGLHLTCACQVSIVSALHCWVLGSHEICAVSAAGTADHTTRRFALKRQMRFNARPRRYSCLSVQDQRTGGTLRCATLEWKRAMPSHSSSLNAERWRFRWTIGKDQVCDSVWEVEGG